MHNRNLSSFSNLKSDSKMPHLSPINWILAILGFWLVLILISSSQWWSQSNKFSSFNTIKSNNIMPHWKW